MQTLRVIVGALGLLFFFLAVRTLTGNGWLAGLSSAGLAVTVSYWTYSTRMDQSINMVALLCVAFYLLVRSKQNGTIGSWRANLPLLAVLVLAAFYNFTGVLTAAVFGVAIAWARPGEALKVRLVRLLSFGALYAGLIVVLGAAGLALLISPARLFDQEYWKTATFAGHPEYGVELADTFRAVIGFAKSLVSFPGLDPTGSLSSFWDAASSGSKVVLLAFYALALAVMVLPFVVFFYRRKLDSRRQWARLLVTGWLVVYSLFNLWWDPGYTKYWLIPLVCLWAAIALALQKIRLEFNRLYRPALGLAALLIVVTFGFNYTTQFLPNSNKSNNASLTASVQLGQKTDPGALFISTGQPVDFYMVYFAQRDVVSIELIKYSANGDSSVTNQILADHIKQHRAAGKPVYVYGLETLTPAERADLLAQIGGATDPKLAFSFPDLKVYQVYPAAAPALSAPATPALASRF